MVADHLSRGQRIDKYTQKGYHLDSCPAYQALSQRTNTKPQPARTNCVAARALLEESD
jgi:hypothetical protein